MNSSASPGSTSWPRCCTFAAVLVVPVAYRSGIARRPGWSVIATLAEGWHYVRSRRVIGGTLAVTLVVNFWGFAYITMVPVIGERRLGLSAVLIGLLMSSEGFGALIGALLVGIYGRAEHYTRIYLGASFLFFLGELGFALSGWFPLSIGLLVVCGLGLAGFAVMQSTIVFLAAPAAVRSRVFGLLTVAIGAGPIGMLHVGFLADWLGAANAVTIIAVEGLVMLALAALLWPELRRPAALEPEEAQPRGATSSRTAMPSSSGDGGG